MSEERFASCLEKTFSLGSKTKEHILRHPEIREEIEKIAKVLKEPDEVRSSLHDPSVLSFHKLYPKIKITSKFLLVAVKTTNEEGFIITAFFTDKMKRGSTVWRRSVGCISTRKETSSRFHTLRTNSATSRMLAMTSSLG